MSFDIIYDAIIRTKLIYGLESTALNQITIRKINAFHMKGLRKICNVPSTYLTENRKYTNEYVLEKINEIYQKDAKEKKKKTKPKKIQLLGDYHKDRRIYMLAKMDVCLETYQNLYEFGGNS